MPIDEPYVRGRIGLRPTFAGWACLGGGAYAVYTGLNEQPVVLTTGLSLVLLGLVDAIICLFILRSTLFSVKPLRTIGDPVKPPTVLVEQSSARQGVWVEITPLWGTDPPVRTIPDALTPQICSLQGSHPIAKGSVEFMEGCSLFGLVSARRRAQVRLRSPVYRGPATNDQVVEIPHMRNLLDLDRLREYVPGDRMGRINWGATARTTKLHVRDEQIEEDAVLVVLSLRSDEKQRDGVVEDTAVVSALQAARSVCDDILNSGRILKLATTEVDGLQEQMQMAAARAIDRRQPKPSGEVHQRLVERYLDDEVEVLKRLALAEPSSLEVAVTGPHVMITLDFIEVNL